MPLNHLNMLSKLSLNMDQLAELLEAEQPELDGVSARIESVKGQFSIHSSTYTISRYEKIFGIVGNGTLEERRAMVLVYLNARPTVTKTYLEELLTAATGCQCTIEEHYGDYHFTVHIRREETTPNLAAMASYLKLLKPAHLVATLRIRQETHGNVTLSCRTKIGRSVKVMPYQEQNHHMDCPVQVAVFTRIGRHIKVNAGGDNQ